MQIPYFDLKKQYASIQSEIDEALLRVLGSGWYVLGKELENFEKSFASYCDAQYAVGVNSGTDAIRLALIACGIKPGDLVATVPNTAVPTIAAIASTGARPVLVDVDPKTYTLDPACMDHLLKKEKGKIKAVVPVHLYGHPADMEPLLAMANQQGFHVIEDACQAHGSEYKGKKVGTLGHAGCFSFYPTKNLGAYGDAGMVTVNDKTLADRLMMLRNYGEKAKYQNAIEGHNSRLDEMQAAVLSVKLRYLDLWNEKRRGLAKCYADLLSGTSLVLPQEAAYAKHIYHLYVVRSKERDKLQQVLEEKGIHTAIHYPMPVHFQKAYQRLGYAKGRFPVAEKLTAEILSLPLYPELKEEEVRHICEVIRKHL